MWLIALVGLAQARPDRPLPRVEDTLVEQRYYSVQDAGPAQCKWRNRRGKFLCWSFPDGVAARIQTFDGRTLASERRFDAGGRALTTATMTDGAVSEVVVHGLSEHNIALESWAPHTGHGVTTRGPGQPEVTADQVRWSGPGTTLQISSVSTQGDVFSDAFRTGLERDCACVVQDRTTTWLGTKAAVRYRLHYPHPTSPHTAELWAAPLSEGTWMMTWTVAHQTDPKALDAALAPGRAAAALLQWEVTK